MKDLTTMSSKGQIVVPKDVREQLDLKEGDAFAVFGNDDMVILKKVHLPSAKEAFEKAARLGRDLAKKKSLKQKDVQGWIHKSRGVT